jgi:hypothetical protein
MGTDADTLPPLAVWPVFRQKPAVEIKLSVPSTNCLVFRADLRQRSQPDRHPTSTLTPALSHPTGEGDSLALTLTLSPRRGKRRPSPTQEF